MQVVENVALISINATLVVQLVSFLVFMMLLNRIMIRPLRVMMSEREAYIRKVGEDLIAANAALEQIAGQIESQEAEARKAAFQIREEIETSGRKSVAGLLTKTRKEIDDLKSEAQTKTEQKIVAASKNIEAEAEMLSNRMITALLGPGRAT